MFLVGPSRVMAVCLGNAKCNGQTKTGKDATDGEKSSENETYASQKNSGGNRVSNLRLLDGGDEFHIRVSRGLRPSSATRRTGRDDCNRAAPAGFAVLGGWLIFSRNRNQCKTACAKLVMYGMRGKLQSHPLATNSKEISAAFCDLQMARLAKCLNLLLGGEKWNIAITLRDRCKTVGRYDVEINNLKPLSLVKSELKSLWLRCRPINVRHVFVKPVKLVNHLNIQAFEDLDYLVILELLI